MDRAEARVARRTWLKTGLLGLGVVALGGVGLALQKTVLRERTPPLKTFDAAEYAVLAAIADRICPALGPGAPGATALGLAETIDQMVRYADAEAQKGLKAALKLIDSALTGALTGERVVPFTQLSTEQQDRSLASFRESSVGFRRTVFGGVAGLITSAYWGDARTWQRLGYKGPPDPGELRAAYADQLVDLDALRATPIAKGT